MDVKSSEEMKSLEAVSQTDSANFEHERVPKYLQETNEALECRIVEGTKHLSKATQDLIAAAEDARLAAVAFETHCREFRGFLAGYER